MARIDTLRLLLAAEIPDDFETCQASLAAISGRIGELDRGSSVYSAAHARLNALLDRVDQLLGTDDA